MPDINYCSEIHCSICDANRRERGIALPYCARYCTTCYARRRADSRNRPPNAPTAECESCHAEIQLNLSGTYAYNAYTAGINTWVCDDCIRHTHYAYCEYCHFYRPRDGRLATPRGYACSDCTGGRDSLPTAECESCQAELMLGVNGDYVYGGYRTSNAPTYVCDSCITRQRYARCDECTYHRPRSGRVVTHQGYACVGCAETMWRCEYCAYYIPGDYGTCPDCGDNYSDSDLIHEHSYRPPNMQFYGDGPLYLGVELEIDTEYGGDRAELAATAADYLRDLGYLKEDGSLNDGFEIVTKPMTYPYLMHNFPWPMLDALADMGAHTDPGRTGLHVHMSRAGFDGPAHIYRWLQWFYRNEQPIIRIARRRSSWGAFNPEARPMAKEYAKGFRRADRYSAINVTNSDTFEVRVFASSLHTHEVKGALGLTHASVEYTRELSAHQILRHGAWSWAPFENWVSEHSEYSDLTTEITTLVPRHYSMPTNQMEIPTCVC